MSKLYEIYNQNRLIDIVKENQLEAFNDKIFEIKELKE